MTNPRIAVALLGVALAAPPLHADTRDAHGGAAGAGKDPGAAAKDHGLFTPDEVAWSPGPPSLPAGAKVALLEGDPGKEGPFTMRLQLPDGYRIPPHWHSKVEHVTVISGTFHLGFGESFDAGKGQAMPAGTFGFMPPGMRHYAWAKGETVVQVHGLGPWDINYVNPADDPRKGAAAAGAPR